MTAKEQEIESFLDSLKKFLEDTNKIKKGDHSETTIRDARIYANLLQSYSHCIDEIRKMMIELNEAKEKIRDLEIRKGGWKNLIPSCFGDQSGTFNGNTLNIDIANKIRKIVREEKIDLEIVLHEFKQSLSKTFPHKAIQNEQEMKKVEKFFKG